MAARDSPELSHRLTQAYSRHQAGDVAGAERIYREILAADPSHVEGLRMLGATAAQLGRYDEAIQLIGRAVRLAPNLARAQFMLGAVFHQAGREEEALAALDRAIELKPGEAMGHYTRARVLQALGRLEQAAAAYRAVIALSPDHHQAQLSLGVVLRRQGDPSSVDVLRRAVQLRPDNPDGHSNLANALQEHGDLAQARDVSARFLAMHPTSAGAWATHVGLRTFAAGDPDLDRMEALLASLAGKSDDEPEKEIILEFALGKAWMDVGDADRAFGHLLRANQLKRATFEYDVRAKIRRLAAIPDGIRALKQRLTGPGHPSELPVFIVGMPRSGTTLLEQILASHADVCGGGELSAFQEAMPEVFEEAGLSPGGAQAGRIRVDSRSQFDPARLGRAYLGRVGALAGGKARLVDKMPGNFNNVGLISLALPNARIIHCRRDPADTCLSCYATRFVTDQLFAYDLVELGQYYRAYAALMEHWRATLPPERFLEVRYEDVLQDLEGQTRRLVAFCGLEWDAACLRFFESRRPVLTASVNQVRRPLYDSSQGRWRAYKTHLGPLIKALQDGARTADGQSN
jgi:tetratricopeptide (TPR) repeat protein